MLTFLHQSISWPSEATDSSTRTCINAYIPTSEYIVAILRPLIVQQEPVLMLTRLHQSISWPSEATDSSTRTCINAYIPTSEYNSALWGHWQFNKNLSSCLHSYIRVYLGPLRPLTVQQEPVLMLIFLHQSILWPSEATDSSTRTCVNAYTPTSEYILALWGHWQFNKNLY